GDSPAPAPKTAATAGTPPAVVAPPVEQALAADVDGGQRPLLMPGKKTLFQRVLSKPGASFSSAPGATPDKPVPAFSVLYVYQRKNLDGRSWLRLGAASDGRSAGWLRAEQVSQWKQSLELKLTNRSGSAAVMSVRQASDRARLVADPAAGKTQ
ncbi:serine/threonine protein kinase, partial [Pseudomonas sp. MWU13-2860]